MGERDHILKYEVSEHQGSGSLLMTCHTESSGFPENGMKNLCPTCWETLPPQVKEEARLLLQLTD